MDDRDFKAMNPEMGFSDGNLKDKILEIKARAI